MICFMLPGNREVMLARRAQLLGSLTSVQMKVAVVLGYLNFYAEHVA
jgi:hypothetical protein